jgi:O-antigen/teichoic acid export membrane protein
MSNKLEINAKKVVNATKWSAIAEVLIKIASPIANIILARLLAPEIFGLIATFTLVTTFTYIFTDSGFQKYLIQNEFDNDAQKDECTNVAFWTNLCISIFAWVIIFALKDQIAFIVGSAGYGIHIAILCIQIPIFSISSIQQALFKRELKFKELAPIRIATSLVPLIVTVPLAAILHNCWAVIIGLLVREIVNAILLTIKSPWRPRKYYSFRQLIMMMNKTLWLMADSFMVWVTLYAGTLVVSHSLDSYYLGVYRTGYTTISSYLDIIFMVTYPVVFSALSRCQSNKQQCDNLYVSYLKYVAYIIMPLGVLLFVYHNLVVNILLGSQWEDANTIIAVAGLVYPVSMLTGQFNSHYFRALGKPNVALIVQIIYACLMIAILMFSVRYSFEFFSVMAGSTGLLYAGVSNIALIRCFEFPYIKMLKGWLPPVCASIVMFVCGIISLSLFESGMEFEFLSAVISLIIYFIIILLIPSSRNNVKNCALMLKNQAEG